MFGNRGCLHDDKGRIVRRCVGTRWIACRLEFKGIRRTLMRPGRYTELFFLDEATAFAAGHRPCAECRRDDYRRFVALWGEGGVREGVSATTIDAQLHAERADAVGHKRLHVLSSVDSVPDGAFIAHQGDPYLVIGDRVLRWTMSGYAAPEPRSSINKVLMITPPSLADILRRGWNPVVPLLHPSAIRCRL